jgi:hypothetical protein
MNAKTEWQIHYRYLRILRKFRGGLGMLCGSDPRPAAMRMALEAQK